MITDRLSKMFKPDPINYFVLVGFVNQGAIVYQSAISTNTDKLLSLRRHIEKDFPDMFFYIKRIGL